MKTKLHCILLIDDNMADNYYHQIVIKEMNIAEKVEVALDGAQAINFLTKENHTLPEIILLDINMPHMNGWEFLEAYKKLDAREKAKMTIIMLTTSVNPEDLEKARRIESPVGFKVKPLTAEMLTEVLEQNFLNN